MPKPLVLVTGTFLCDATPQHEVHVVTDGLRAYAAGLSACSQGSRHADGPILFTCRQQTGTHGADVLCDGQVVVTLSPADWDAATDWAISLLNTGERIEHSDHEPLPVTRPADPKICAECGRRRDPVTGGWYAVDEFEVLLAERRERRARFGESRPEGEYNARAMNQAGL